MPLAFPPSRSAVADRVATERGSDPPYESHRITRSTVGQPRRSISRNNGTLTRQNATASAAASGTGRSVLQ